MKPMILSLVILTSSLSFSREDSPKTIRFCGMEVASNQNRVTCRDAMIKDVTPLMELSELKILDLSGTQVRDLTLLQEFTNLEKLWFIDTRMKDLTPLQGLANLKELYLIDTVVKDLTPLQRIPNLRILNLHETKVDKEQVDALKKALPETEIDFSFRPLR